jgi:exosortase K
MFIDTVINRRTGAPAERHSFGEYSAPPERILSSASDLYKYFVLTGRKLSQFLTQSNWNRIAQLITVLVCGVALKYFYSTASVNQLRWILAPATLLVELVSGARFQFESHAGYMSSDHTFLIAASCSGVNFLLTAFLMLGLGKLWRNRSQKLSWSFIPIAALLAYASTLIANTVRISTALRLRRMPAEMSWLTPDQLHRFEGIFIYFGFLLLLYVVSERFGAFESKPVLDAGSVGARGPVRRYVFPLAIYYATTLGIPFLNGAFRQADFWEHSRWVLLIPLVFVIIPLTGFVLVRRISRWCHDLTFM